MIEESEPRRELLPRRQGVGIRLERRLSHRLELHGPLRELALPRGETAQQDRHPRMSGELRHLSRGHRADSVAAIDEHETLLARDAVTPQSQGNFFRELGDRSLVGARGR